MVVAASVVACSRRATPRGPARRIVTLGPNTTEILFALGAGDRVVGVSRYDDYPPEALRLPRVGGLLDPSFEAIVALRPDAVVGAQGPLNRTVLDRLERLGIRTLFPRVESVADIGAAIDAFAALVDRHDAAVTLRRSIDADIATVRARVAARPAPSVLAVFGQRPISVAGPGSFVNELLGLANARNVVREGPAWPTLGLEAVLALAPEIILDMTGMEHLGSLAEAWAQYSAIPAIRNRRVVRLDDPMLLRPGPRVARALDVYARAVHDA
jgi:iron complex transport system substrate-binding protein